MNQIKEKNMMRKIRNFYKYCVLILKIMMYRDISLGLFNKYGQDLVYYMI